MTSSRGNFRRALIAGLPISAFSLVIACSAWEDVKALARLAAAVSEEFDAQATVNLSNGTHLLVTLQNSPAANLEPGEREAFARKVAEFAAASYANAGGLSTVAVTFASVRGGGPVRVTQTEAPYRWSMSQLAKPADVAEEALDTLRAGDTLSDSSVESAHASSGQ